MLQNLKEHLKAIWPVTIRRKNAKSDKDNQTLLKTVQSDCNNLKKDFEQRLHSQSEQLAQSQSQQTATIVTALERSSAELARVMVQGRAFQTNELTQAVKEQIRELFKPIETVVQTQAEIETLLAALKAQHQADAKQLHDHAQALTDKLAKADAAIAALTDQYEILRKQSETTATEIKTASPLIQQIQTDTKAARYHAFQAQGEAAEAVWAEIFNNTITDSTWLRDKKFSPGRWAIGYQFLYAMYRILDETHPKHILELGLGQSTKMISQYVSANENVLHYVVEHDPEWIAFYKKANRLNQLTHIVQLDREMVTYKDAQSVRAFKDFKVTFDRLKFDFIVIDAPLGGDMKQYARIDVLQMLPDILDEKWCIMVDDTERPGETHMVQEIENCLKSQMISYAIGKYCGKKHCTVISSKQLAFLTTM